MAIRFACKGKGTGEISLSDLRRRCRRIPKNLRYIVTDLSGFRRTFRVATALVGSRTLNPRERFRFRLDERPPLRPMPLPGKWSVDWIDESVYDHISPNYEAY